MKRPRIRTALLVLALASPAAAQWTASEEARLDSTTPVAGDELGKSIGLDGDTLVVGSPGANQGAVIDAGEAQVYTRSGTTWSAPLLLKGSDTAAGDRFGSGVAVAGDTLVVGASHEAHAGAETGAAYVFVRAGTAWTETQKLVASDASANDQFGGAVAMNGDTLLIGAPRDRILGFNDAGSAYVFERVGSVWSETQKLTASNTSPIFQFGSSLSLDGDVAGIGAVGALRIYVFERSAGSWSEVVQLTAPTQNHAQGIGRSVGVSGLTVVFGSPNDDLVNPLASNAGSVFVHVKRNGIWSMEQKLKASDYAKDDFFGRSVAIEGELAVIGAHLDDAPLVDSGSAYVFARTGTTWVEQTKIVASDASAGAQFGRASSLSAGRIAIGAPEAAGDGAAYVFTLSPPAPVSYCTAGTSASGCRATLSAAGAASATASSGFVVSAASVEGDKDGLFFYGSSGRQANPWGNGTSLQCVTPPVRRGGLQVGGGTAGLCDGAIAQDLNARWCPSCPRPMHNPGVGVTAEVQLWYRDPASTSNLTTSLSDALEFAVGP
jgi:hypothetical protein